MTFKEKRRSKKLASIYMIIAYAMVILFFTLVVLSATHVISFSNGKTDANFWQVLLGVSPLFVSIFFGMFSSWSAMKRTTYKYKIKMYREYKHFNIILDYLEAGKVKEARDLFNSLPEGYLRVFINGMIFSYRLLSDDAELQTSAKEKLNTLREDFCHHNVQF